MKPMTDNYERHEQIIAALLWYGTWLASAVIAAGMALSALQQLERLPAFSLSGYDLVKAGVALFILLPVVRVALAIFLGERDYAYMVISTLVLAIIGAGILIGL